MNDKPGWGINLVEDQLKKINGTVDNFSLWISWIVYSSKLQKVDNIHIFSSKNSNELLGSSKLSYQKIDGKKKTVNCKSIGIIPDTPFNVILCCKSYSISKFVSQFSSNKNLIRVISIQNGIGHIKKLERIGEIELLLEIFRM